MPRSRAEQRHHRARVIAARVQLVRSVQGDRPLPRGPGALSKDHLTNCSCLACRPHRLERRRFAQRWRE